MKGGGAALFEDNNNKKPAKCESGSYGKGSVLFIYLSI